MRNFQREDQFRDVSMGGGDGKEKEEYNGQHLTPLTIKQIKELKLNEQERYFYVNKEIVNIVICGKIEEMESTSQKTSMILQDGTGEMKCINWRPDPDFNKDFAKGDDVKVFGQIRDWKERTITVNNMYKIATYNELINHFLEVIYIYNVKKKGDLKEDVEMEDKKEEPLVRDGDTLGIILKYIQDNGGTEGAAYTNIVMEFGGMFSENEIKACVRRLLKEGRIYTGSSDQMFLAK